MTHVPLTGLSHSLPPLPVDPCTYIFFSANFQPPPPPPRKKKKKILKKKKKLHKLNSLMSCFIFKLLGSSQLYVATKALAMGRNKTYKPRL